MTSKYDGVDHYVDPATGVLLNKLGLTSQEALDQAEAAFVALATAELAFAPILEPKNGPDFSYLLAIHKKLFGDVYEWAGTIRDVDISKGVTRFANFQFIEVEGKRLAKEMAAKNWFRGLSHEDFADQLAFYFGELNVLHPFRDGNGRSLREYVRHIAERAGHKINWEGLDRKQMLSASVYAYNVDHRMLRSIIIQQMTCCS